jgi:hypothetical protein
MAILNKTKKYLIPFIISLYIFVFGQKSNVLANGSDFIIDNLNVKVTVEKDGWVGFEENLKIYFKNKENSEFIRQIPISAGLDNNQELEYQIDGLQVTNKNGESVKFVKKKSDGLLNLKIHGTPDNNYEIFNIKYKLGGFLTYYTTQDAVNIKLSEQIFKSELKNAAFELILPSDIEEKNINFSCFNEEKDTKNCRAVISGYRLKYEVSDIKSNEVYTITARFPMGVVKVIKPIKSKDFISENMGYILSAIGTVLVFIGFIFIIYRLISDKKYKK